MGIIIDKDLEIYRKYIKDNLNKKRYMHSLGVSYTAASLAMAYNTNIYNAQIAGILHDCAKCYDSDELIKLCKKSGINISDTEYNSPELLHSKYGAFIAQSKLNITDEDILNAIKYHTTGRAGMSELEKIIFIADYIEPSRSNLKDMDIIRKTAFSNIDKAITIVCQNTIDYLQAKGGEIDNTTLETYNYYINL